jgi:uncharacterized protein YoxC
MLIFLTIAAAMIAAIYITNTLETESAARSRSLITFEVVDALIDIIFIERRHQLHTFQVILDDKEEVLAEVDSLLFQRGEFPGSVLEMNDRDYNRLCRVINRVYQDTHYDIASTKSYMRAALSI